jgi:hypothetical protein
VGGYANDEVTIASSQSSEAGTLNASSAINFVNNGLKVYNIIFSSTYRTEAQVS